MSKSKIFIGAGLAFAAGILLASRLALDLFYVYMGLALAVGIFIYGLFMRPSAKLIRLAGIFLFFGCLGIWRFGQALKPNEYQNFFEQKIKWEGFVAEDVDERADKQLIIIQPKGFHQSILVTTTKAQAFFYGDWLAVEGKLKPAKAFNDFDYPGYLERFNIYALMSYPKILILKSHQGNTLKESLLKVKHGFIDRVSRYLKEPQNSLALGILIGARRGLPPDVVENFNLTGTSHIVAMSGFNITVIITALSYLAWIVGRRANFWLSLMLIVGFVIIAGASASVLRAAVMGILLLIAFNLGRMYSVVPAMLFAAALMLYLNPKILFWDVGFQLSFAATWGLVCFMPLLDVLTQKWPKFLGLKNIFLGTLAAMLSTLPLILWYFGRLSLVALLANLLVLPVVPAAMLFGFLIVLPLVAPGFAFIANWLLVYMLFVIEKLARLPFASVQLKISPWILAAMIGLLFGLYFILRRLAARQSSKFDKIVRV